MYATGHSNVGMQAWYLNDLLLKNVSIDENETVTSANVSEYAGTWNTDDGVGLVPPDTPSDSPTLTLVGDSIVYIVQNSLPEYTDEGATALDAVDGDI